MLCGVGSLIPSVVDSAMMGRASIDMDALSVDDEEGSCNTQNVLSLIIHALITLCILSFSLLIALEVKTIVQVWSVMGSTVGMCIGFILPCVFCCVMQVINTFNISILNL